MSVPRLPARKLSTRRRHGDSDDEDVAVSVQRQRPPPVEELDEEADFASSVEDSDDDSDDGVHDPACRTDLYPAQSQRQSGEHRSLTLSLHHAFGIHQLRRQVSTSSSGASQWQEAASPHSGLRQGSHSITKASSNRTGTSSGKQNLDVGATDTPQRDRSPEDALQLRGTGALPSKASLPQGSIESRREGGANPTRGLSGSVPPGHVQAGRNPESEYLPLRGGLETSSSSSPADEWRSFSIAHPPPFTGLSRQPVSSWWGRISEGESNYVLPHVSKELCSDEYGKDNSKQVKCCGFCPLIFTRKGWKMFFSVFWQEDNFDLLLRNYVPEDPQRRQYTSHHSDSEHAGPPSNTMYSAGRAASQHRRLMHVGTSAGQYAGRVAQFSKEPESAVKHKAATRRIMKGYPFVTFRYQPLNRAYNYLLGQVVPVKVIWASLFALIGQALLSVGQTLMALNRTNLLVDVSIRAGVCLGFLAILLVLPLFARFRFRVELIVTCLSVFFFLCCCIFKTWQMIGGRTGPLQLLPSPQAEGEASAGYENLIHDGNNLFEVFAVVVLTASSIRTSLMFYVHMAAALNVVFTCAVKCILTRDAVAIISTATAGYFILCIILLVMYIGYHREVTHRLAFYSWYRAKYRICPPGASRKLSNMATMLR